MAASMAGPMARADPAAPALAHLEMDLLLEALYQRFGHDFRAYERAALERRLRVLMDERGLATISALQEQLLHAPGVEQELLRALALAPAGLFEDPAFARDLRRVLAASLRACALPKIWLPECTGAAEAWALAIVLAEQKLDARTAIFATVANDSLLQEMRDASVPVASLAQWQDLYLQGGGTGELARFFDCTGECARLRADLRERITWFQSSLVTDASFNEFQVIICRRALPDFGPALRQRVLGLFHDSLARFGLLALDRQLAPADAHAGSYQAIGTEQHWYKRVA